MGLEAADYIWELVDTNPEATDGVNQGDDHLRMIKKTLPNSFPNMTAPWTTTSEVKGGDPTTLQSFVTLGFLASNSDRIGWPMIWLLDALPVVGSYEYVDLQGQAVSRVTYATLFALYGVTYGAGDGVTTFNLPDARGLFMRVMDSGAGVDPNAATRTDRGDGVIGDNVGTKQDDVFEAHTHNQKGSSPIGTGGGGVGYFLGSTASPYDSASAGGSETRPKNMYVRFIIRAK